MQIVRSLPILVLPIVGCPGCGRPPPPLDCEDCAPDERCASTGVACIASLSELEIGGDMLVADQDRILVANDFPLAIAAVDRADGAVTPLYEADDYDAYLLDLELTEDRAYWSVWHHDAEATGDVLSVSQEGGNVRTVVELEPSDQLCVDIEVQDDVLYCGRYGENGMGLDAFDASTGAWLRQLASLATPASGLHIVRKRIYWYGQPPDRQEPVIASTPLEGGASEWAFMGAAVGRYVIEGDTIFFSNSSGVHRAEVGEDSFVTLASGWDPELEFPVLLGVVDHQLIIAVHDITYYNDEPGRVSLTNSFQLVPCDGGERRTLLDGSDLGFVAYGAYALLADRSIAYADTWPDQTTVYEAAF